VHINHDIDGVQGVGGDTLMTSMGAIHECHAVYERRSFITSQVQTPLLAYAVEGMYRSGLWSSHNVNRQRSSTH
jgi:hypothetical protein